MTHAGLWNELKLDDQIKKLKKKLREAEGELSIIKGINFNSDKQKEINILEEQVKEAREINKLHQELNGVLRVELDLEKKNHAITREDVQAKDLELGRMMQKLTQKK
tara:strand:- start:109 stop:429 length:321 start_codon:yes stop_codon:yes gene_type:complete